MQTTTILSLLLASCAKSNLRPSATRVMDTPDEAWRNFSSFIFLRHRNDKAKVTDAQMADFLRANRFLCSAPEAQTAEATCQSVSEVVTDSIATPYGFIWQHASAKFTVRIRKLQNGWRGFTAFSARRLPP